MSTVVEKLKVKIETIVKSHNFELYYLEYIREGGQNILRVYIDRENGVKLDDCVVVSRAISDMLDACDPITEEYNLEVSSPGVFRTLFTDSHMERYIGSDVEVKLSALFEGKKKFEGKLVSFNDEEVTIENSGVETSIPKSKILAVSLNPAL